jgi:hypothetical protein
MQTKIDKEKTSCTNKCKNHSENKKKGVCCKDSKNNKINTEKKTKDSPCQYKKNGMCCKDILK